MKRRPAILLTLLLLAALLLAAPARATRIKDLAGLEGVRENQLMGYGLVIGLNGTGDDIKKSVFTKQAIANMVKRMGMGMTADVFRQMKTENVAAVMVTAQLPAFARPGTTIDILVSSIGDATSLSGGTLLMTPLKGPDGNTYAVAQGPLAVGGIAFGGKAAKGVYVGNASAWTWIPVVIGAVATVWLGLVPDQVMQLATFAGGFLR